MLEMGVGAGVGNYLSLNEVKLAKRVLAVSASVTATQLIEMKAGLRNKFDARAVMLQATATLIQPAIEQG